MPDFTRMTDRAVLIELARHRALAESCATELMRRASEDANASR